MQKSLKVFFVLCAFFALHNAPVFSQESIPENPGQPGRDSADAERMTSDMIIMGKAKIRILNKQLGRVNTATVTVGESHRFENLEIMVRACHKNKEYDATENIMFVTVKDTDSKYVEEKSTKQYDTIFSGWMFSSSPSLSAMEHAIYDIWILSCEN